MTLDAQLLETFEVKGKKPLTAIVIEIDRVYFQCARALKRSQIWNPASYLEVDSLPSAGTLIRSAIDDFDAKSYDAQLQERQEQTLY